MKEIKDKLLREIMINAFLLTLGSILIAIGIKSIILPHGLLTGGASGLALLGYYIHNTISVDIWYILINIPIFLIGWFSLGREFFFYTVYGTIILSLSIRGINFTLSISNEVLVILLGGIIIGLGLGLIFSSKGSTGGFDIVGIILKKKFNIKISIFYFVSNLTIFTLSLFFIDTNIIILSIISSYFTCQIMENTIVFLRKKRKSKYNLIIQYNTQLKKVI